MHLQFDACMIMTYRARKKCDVAVLHLGYKRAMLKLR
jgi:hypothetical protein